MSYRYSAFGLCIESTIKFDELSVELNPKREVDLFIREKNLNFVIAPMGEAKSYMDYENPTGVLMMWPGVAAVKIKSASEVEIQCYPGIPEKYMAFPVLGPIMGWILHQKGLLVLHSSAVRMDGKSIAFMGDKRAGKSTTAAAFLKAGAKLLTDDLLAIDMSYTPKPMIRPAFAQIKLNEESSHLMKIPDSKALPLVMPGFEKRQYRLNSMESELVPSDVFFVIERGGEVPQITWLEGGAGFPKLIRYSYNVRFSEAPDSLQNHAQHFENCVMLENKASVGILNIPSGIEQLGTTIDFVRKALSTETF